MKKIFISLFIVVVSTFADFFPKTTYATIMSIEGRSATLSNPLPVNNMSGIVMHTFKNGKQAITSLVVQNEPKEVNILNDDLLEHRGLPTPKSLAQPGDKVIGGYLYDNVLVLAPNAKTYAKITESNSKHWIHPDLYAAYLARVGDDSPSYSNLAGFAKEAQVGLIYIVQKNRAVLFDPISKEIIAKKPFQPIGTEAKYPFYNRFSSTGNSFFSSGGDYYDSVGEIQ